MEKFVAAALLLGATVASVVFLAAEPVADLQQVARLSTWWDGGPRGKRVTPLEPSADTLDRVLDLLPRCPSAKQLALPAMPGLRERLPRIAKLRHVVALDLRGLDLEDEDLALLAGMTQLESIDLTGNPRITDEGIARLAQCTRLKRLKLGGTNVTGTGLAQLAQCRKVRVLDLSNCPVTDETLLAIPRFPQAAKVSLFGTEVTDEGLMGLTDWHRLVSLRPGPLATDAGKRRFNDRFAAELLRARAAGADVPAATPTPIVASSLPPRIAPLGARKRPDPQQEGPGRNVGPGPTASQQAQVAGPVAPATPEAAGRMIDDGELAEGLALLARCGPAAIGFAPELISMLPHDRSGAPGNALLAIDPRGDVWGPAIAERLGSADPRTQREGADMLLGMAVRTSLHDAVIDPSANVPRTDDIRFVAVDHWAGANPDRKVALDRVVALSKQALDSADPVVRQQAIGPLKYLGAAAVGARDELKRLAMTGDAMEAECCEALAMLGPDGVRPLVEVLEAGSGPSTRQHWPLIGLGRVANTRLDHGGEQTEGFAEADPRVDFFVAALEASAREGIPAIVRALDAHDAATRAAALHALETIDPRPFDEQRHYVYDDATPADRGRYERFRRAIEGVRAAVLAAEPHVRHLLEDEDAAVREQAVVTLALLHP